MGVIRRSKSVLGKRETLEGMANRVPTGQYVTSKMPVMNIGIAPSISIFDWKLRVFGLVEQEVEFSWDDFQSLSKKGEEVDFHCVTQWSRQNVGWEGVSASDILDQAQPTSVARFVMLHCADNYTTNVDLQALLAPDVLFAHKMDGQALHPNHGYPVRLVVPARYGWKSAKWVTGVELMAKDRPGFWELNGYHMRGDPWREERFSHC